MKLRICFGPVEILVVSCNILVIKYLQRLKYIHTFTFKTYDWVDEKIPILEIIDSKDVKVNYSAIDKRIKLFINWEAFNKTNILENILLQCLFLLSVDSKQWPMHASSVETNNKGILLMGAATSGKTNVALGLCSLGKCRLVADDWLSLKIVDNKIFVQKSDDLISIRKHGFENVGKILPKSVADMVKKRFGTSSSPFTKTIPPFLDVDLKIIRATLPVQINKFIFVHLIENFHHYEKISKGKMINLIANEYVKALNGFSSYFIDNNGNVVGEPIVTIPGLGWKKILSFIDEITNICEGYIVYGSLQQVINDILELNEE